MGDVEALKQHSTLLSQQMIDLEEFELAEELLVRVGDIKQAVTLLNKAGQWQRGYELASR